jgi:hypothetical protein
MSRGWQFAMTVLCAALCLAACDSDRVAKSRPGEALPPSNATYSASANQPRVEHPEFGNWRQFPEGARVIRKKEVSNETETVRVTTVVRLVEKTSEKVVVESQITVDRPGQPVVENPPARVEFPASFELPAGMQVEQFLLPSLKAKQVGEEPREVNGKTYQAVVFAWDERNEAGPMQVKLWRSDEIPGRMLRQEVNGRTQTSVEEVVEVLGEVGERP